MAQALRIKTYAEIISGMLTRARRYINEDVDLEPGSAVRTILECAALQDADQYVQIGNLLNLFSLAKCKGDDLDERAVELGSDIFTDLRRKPANTSISKILVGDGTLAVKDTLVSDALIGDATFTVIDGSDFPSSGAVVIEPSTDREEEVIFTRVGDVFTLVFPAALTANHPANASIIHVSTRSTITGAIIVAATTATLATGTGAAWGAAGDVIFERGTIREETLTFTRVGDVLTFAPTAFAHDVDTTVIQSTFGSNRAISVGLTTFVPASDTTKQITFRTTSTGTLLDGDFLSDLVDVESEEVGYDTRAGANTITQWATAPFSGATVTNPVAATRGADREKDDPYRQRLRDVIQSLSSATPLAITTDVAGLVDPETGAEVAFVQIVEPVAPGTSYLYITDGTSTFSLGQQPYVGRDVLITDAENNDARGKLSILGPYAYAETGTVTPRIFKSGERGVATSVGFNYLEDTSQAWGVNTLVGFFLKTDDDQFYAIVSNTAIRITIADGVMPSLGSFSVFDFTVPPLIPGTDYVFNEATGDLELTTPLVAHDGLVAADDGGSPSQGAYLYSTGLAAYVQRKVNGDPSDFINYPGLKATGTKIVVRVPTITARLFLIKVVAARGFTDAQLIPSVKVIVQTYVNSLGIGDNVLRSEIIRLVKSLPGVGDCDVIDPPGNVIIPAGTMMRIDDTNVVGV